MSLPTVLKVSAENLAKVIQLIKWIDDVPSWLEVPDRFFESVEDQRDELLPDVDYIHEMCDVVEVYVNLEDDKLVLEVSFDDDRDPVKIPVEAE